MNFSGPVAERATQKGTKKSAMKGCFLQMYQIDTTATLTAENKFIFFCLFQDMELNVCSL
jgi:hypothetical protein